MQPLALVGALYLAGSLIVMVPLIALVVMGTLGSAFVLGAAGGNVASLAGVVLAMDRQERGQSDRSAVQEVEATFGIRCVSIITLSNLIESLQLSGRAETLAAMNEYRSRYGI